MSLSADGRNRFAQRLFAPLPPRYDRLEEILSMGQHRRRRRAMVGQIIPAAAGGAGSGSGKESSGGDASPDGEASPDGHGSPGEDANRGWHGSPGGHGNAGDRVVLDVASGTAGAAL